MYTAWIRPSRGQLCIDLTPPESRAAGFALHTSDTGPSGTLLDPPDTLEMISSIPNRDYHAICDFHLSRYRWVSVSTDVLVHMGSIRHFSGVEYDSSFEIAVVSDDGDFDGGWRTEDPDIEDCWLPCV
jgi:hypothetical protein